MKDSILLLVVFLFSFGLVPAQNIPGVPNGAANKDSRDDFDNGIRLRSIELERIKGDFYRSIAEEKAAEHRKINYVQIKKDFELVQKLENSIVKTYVTGEKINYRLIGELASKLNDCAKRLETNLSLSTDKAEKKPEKEKPLPNEVRDLIIVLDKSVGKFVASSIFKNLLIIETKDAEKAESELQNIIRLSNTLSAAADKRK